MAINTIDERGTIVSDPLRSFRFRVDFKPASGTAFDNRIISQTGTAPGTKQGFSGGFTGVGGLGVSLSTIEYREGGYNTTVHKMPGMASFDPLTLSRGMLFGNDQSITWMRGLFAAASGEGLRAASTGVDKNFRCTVDIYVMDHPNTNNTNDPRVMFRARNAWISNLGYSGLDAASNTVMVETITLQHEGLSVMFVNVDEQGVITPYDPDYNIMLK